MKLFPQHPGLKTLALIGYVLGAVFAFPFIGGLIVLVVQIVTGDKNPEPLGIGIAVGLVLVPLMIIGLIALLVSFGLSFRKKKEPIGSKLRRTIGEKA